MKVEFTTKLNHAGVMSWSLILRGLKAESGLELYDDAFEEWVLKEWNIKLLHGNSLFPGHLTGMEIDDQTMTMLMLKFPKAFFSQV
jgi:hypothetical protein